MRHLFEGEKEPKERGFKFILGLLVSKGEAVQPGQGLPDGLGRPGHGLVHPEGQVWLKRLKFDLLAGALLVGESCRWEEPLSAFFKEGANVLL